MFSQERLGIVPGMKMQGVEKVARGHQEIGLPLERLAERGQRFVVASLILVQVAQGIAWLGKIGVELNGPFEGRDRKVELPLLMERGAEIVAGLGLIGLEREGAVIG